MKSLSQVSNEENNEKPKSGVKWKNNEKPKSGQSTEENQKNLNQVNWRKQRT